MQQDIYIATKRTRKAHYFTVMLPYLFSYTQEERPSEKSQQPKDMILFRLLPSLWRVLVDDG